MNNATFAKHLTISAAFCLTLVACTPVENWRAFDVDWDRKLESQAQHSVDIPDDLRVDSTAIPDIDIDGDGPLTLSVEQAVVLALSNNRDLAVARVNPVIEGAFEQIERGVYDPELFAEFAYSEGEATEVARATGDRFNVVSEEADVVAGVRQRLPTGTDIEVGVSQNRTISSRSPELQEARLGATITQSLLEGLGPAVNLASIRQAQLGIAASQYELRGFTEAVLADTEIAYWLYTLAQEQIAIFERSLDIAKQQLDQIEQQIEVGVLAETQAAAARAEVAFRDQQLIDARSDLVDRRLRLLRLINPNPAQNAFDQSIETSSNPRIPANPIDDLDDRLQLAQQMRPDINEAILRLDQDRLETIVTRNGLLPKLDLFIDLGKSGYDDRVDDSFRAIDDRAYDLTAGVRFSQSLGNRTAEGLDLAARATRRQSAAALANLRQVVDLDVRLAVNEVERARRQIVATAETSKFQEQTVEAEKQRFEVGTSTSLLVAQAQRDLLAVEIAAVQTIVNYRIALVRLYLAEGSLLERRGIEMANTQGPP